MDEIDLQILQILKANSRTTSSDISKMIHLSVPSIAERIRKLEKNGVIDQFTVKLNRRAIGQHCTVYIFVQRTVRRKPKNFVKPSFNRSMCWNAITPPENTTIC